MRKSALLLAFLIAAASPTVALAKHVRHHRAAAAAAAPVDPNADSMRMWRDLFMAPMYIMTGTNPPSK